MLNKSYRGQVTELSNVSFGIQTANCGAVQLRQPGYASFFGDGNKNCYSVTIHADMLLETARLCLLQLGRNSGVHYRIAVCVGDKSFWIGE